MALEEYRRKRDFKTTPEPAATVVESHREQLAYVIQKHAATRLHYDFRLELDGVLLSWAVTKGPSLNPADKRLAVKVEDHPLAYGSFEGTIPQGEYGGGTVMLWDTGTWEPVGDPQAGLAKGHLVFALKGRRLKGKWALIRMRGEAKRENWLLIKENDDEARRGADADILETAADSVTTGRSMDEIASHVDVPKSSLSDRYPEAALATLVEKAPAGDQWIHEIKFDGYRLLGFIEAGDYRLRTRNEKDWTSKFPSLSAAMAKLTAKEAVLDMEAVVLDQDGRSNFQALQGALGDGGDRTPIVAFVFDLLYLDGQDLTSKPLLERKKMLQKLLGKSAALRYSDHVEGSGPEFFAQACGKGLEGIISKRKDAAYSASRTRDWLKTKCIQRQEFIILGYSAAKSGERALGALYLGYKDSDEIRYAGKVGTGFTMESARTLAGRLAGIGQTEPTLTRAETPDIAAAEYRALRWVKPKLICEVAFTEWTAEGRVRHPSFQGLREDKPAAKVRKEVPGALVLEGVTITHPGRVISEVGQVTKGALAEYYAAVAPWLLPRVARHPISVLRCPEGVDKQCFYQRNTGRGLGADVHPYEFKHAGRTHEYLYIEDAKGLLELVQMGAIEIHPWGASIDNIDCPDRLVFDLDPDPAVPFEALKLAAQDLRARLRKKGLESLLKCTGGKGLHVIVPLAATDEWPVVKAFAAALAQEMVTATPGVYVATMSKAKRTGKIFIDYFRNDYTSTSVMDYAVRARPGAAVAVPLDWAELKALKSADAFKMADVLKRIGKKKDPFDKVAPQKLPSGYSQ